MTRFKGQAFAFLAVVVAVFVLIFVVWVAINPTSGHQAVATVGDLSKAAGSGLK